MRHGYGFYKYFTGPAKSIMEMSSAFWWMSFPILRAALAFLKLPWWFFEGGPRELCEKCFNHPIIPSSHHPPPLFSLDHNSLRCSWYSILHKRSSIQAPVFAGSMGQAASQPGIIPTNSCHLFFSSSVFFALLRPHWTSHQHPPPPPHLKPKINPLLGGDCGRKRLKLGIRSFRKNAVAVVNLHQLYINFPSHSEFHENQITPKKTIKFHHFVNHLMTTAVVRKVRMRRMWTTPHPWQKIWNTFWLAPKRFPIHLGNFGPHATPWSRQLPACPIRPWSNKSPWPGRTQRWLLGGSQDEASA